MIEAWALGDADAIAKVANVRAKRDPCPSAPEELWGDDKDTASSHPQCVLPRVLGKEPTAEMFEELAQEVDLDKLAEWCPESFEPLLRELWAVVPGAATDGASRLANGPKPRREGRRNPKRAGSR